MSGVFSFRQLRTTARRSGDKSERGIQPCAGSQSSRTVARNKTGATDLSTGDPRFASPESSEAGDLILVVDTPQIAHFDAEGACPVGHEANNAVVTAVSV